MSFLNPVRLAFAGRFQADVSTVNNDVRHYDNAGFEPGFQDTTRAGLRNPRGSGAFRFIDCQVTGVWWDGHTEPRSDPVVGLWIAGSPDRASAKLVDLDPQWQMASEIWGLDVRLTDGEVPAIFRGRFRPTAFRDLWPTREVGTSAHSKFSATFQSVLEDVEWHEAGTGSEFLASLKDRTAEDRLSIRLTTFGYQLDPTDPQFTLGTVVGVIGPYAPKEPESFVAGRRFTPGCGFSSWKGITYFSGLVDKPSSTLFLDLSNALQIENPFGKPRDIGDLVAGILLEPTVAEETPVTPESFEPIAPIPYREMNWLDNQGGVFATRLNPDQLERAAELPLALVASGFDPSSGGFDLGYGVVAIRESAACSFLGAEPLVHRIDAGGTSQVTLHAFRYGQRLPRAEATLRHRGCMSNLGADETEGGDTPKAAVPDIGVPEGALSVPESVETDDDGTAQVTFMTTEPGNPRGYIDGQVYLVDYRLPGQANTARNVFDYIAVHVREAVAEVEDPSWEPDIKPIFTLYANLYPIMSRQLVNLADLEDVRRHKRLLQLAFSLDIGDPNYMPVTRDLSDEKRRMILRWLGRLPDPEPGEEAVEPPVPDPVGTTPPAAPDPATAPAGPLPSSDSKALFAAAFRRDLQQPHPV